jgi:Ca2+-binding RTX toxin-like protein
MGPITPDPDKSLYGNNDSTLYDAHALKGVGAIIDAADGNDTIWGSAQDDRLNGGAGIDAISGGGGNDIIAGGTGVDRVSGGAGNDTFLFAAGDIGLAADQGGQMDHIIDFQGAGGFHGSVGGADDFIYFTGFGEGASLHFNHALGGNERLQMYDVVSSGKIVGNILVQMADGAAHLTDGDYLFA